MSTNFAGALPMLFRKRRYEDPNVDPDVVPNVASPDTSPALPPVVAPDAAMNVPVAPVPDQTPDVPNIAIPQTVGTPMVSPTTGQTMDARATRPLRVETDERGRPIPQVNAIDPEQQALEYNQRLNTYQPEAAHGFKDRYLKPIIGAALRGLQYGPGGALGGAATGAISAAVDPTIANRQYKQRELVDSNQQVAGILAQRKAAQAQAQANATLGKTTADTALTLKKLNTPDKAVPGSVHQDINGNWVLVDRVKGTSSQVLDKDGNPLKGKPTGAKSEWVHDANGVAHKYENGKDTGLVDPGRNLIKAPDGSFISPNVKYAADRTAASGNSQAKMTNDALDKNISDAQLEQKKIDDGLKTVPATVETTDIFGNTKTTPNPVYTDAMRRYRELDDHIRTWRGQRKSSKNTSTGTVAGAAAVDPNDPEGLGIP